MKAPINNNGDKSWVASSYRETVNPSCHATPVVENLLASISDKNSSGELKILDLGCGDGLNTFKMLEMLRQALPNKTITIVGVDYSQNMIDAANKSLKEKNLSNISFYQGNASKLYETVTGLEDGCFDAVVSISAFHWIKEQESIARSISRAVKKDGIVSVEFAYQSPLEVRLALINVLTNILSNPSNNLHNRLKESLKPENPDILLSEANTRIFIKNLVENNDKWVRTTDYKWAKYLNDNKLTYKNIVPVTRTQPLKNGTGMQEWLSTFASDGLLGFLEDGELKKSIITECEQELKKPSYQLYDAKVNDWHVDYYRLSVTASKEPLLVRQLAFSTASARAML